ncbi:sigma-70 family RNA polymerase sigma factor [Streptomyces sp. NPDC008125]|uniref:sigma-70 family RNA polymerase sigma factor n=1 Tax=Streptomyces sp. NPDC008125 TaxID=3364811 RepID=UPI0036F08B19
MQTVSPAKPRTLAGGPWDADVFRRLRMLPPGPEREALRVETICLWLPTAHRLASHFADRGEPLEDLRQVAALGLIEAVDQYDPTRHRTFVTHAEPLVAGELRRYLRDGAWHAPLPRPVGDLRDQVRASRRRLARARDGSLPSWAEVAADTGLSDAEVIMGMEALHRRRTTARVAEAAGTNGRFAPYEQMDDGARALDAAVDREAIRPALRTLPERERTILYLRYFCDMTQSRIARSLGISQVHVSYLLSRSCRRLRAHALQEAA